MEPKEWRYTLAALALRKWRRHKKLGYWLAYWPDHPNSDRSGSILIYWAVVAAHLQRPLERWEHVHHINR